MASKTPKNGSLVALCGVNGGKEITKVIRGKEIGEGVKEVLERRVSGGRPSEIGGGDFAFAGGERVGRDVAELQGNDGVGAHGRTDNFSVAGGGIPTRSRRVRPFQHRKRPVGRMPPRETMSGMSARQETAIPPKRQ